MQGAPAGFTASGSTMLQRAARRPALWLLPRGPAGPGQLLPGVLRRTGPPRPAAAAAARRAFCDGGKGKRPNAVARKKKKKGTLTREEVMKVSEQAREEQKLVNMLSPDAGMGIWHPATWGLGIIIILLGGYNYRRDMEKKEEKEKEKEIAETREERTKTRRACTAIMTRVDAACSAYDFGRHHHDPKCVSALEAVAAAVERCNGVVADFPSAAAAQEALDG